MWKNKMVTGRENRRDLSRYAEYTTVENALER